MDWTLFLVAVTLVVATVAAVVTILIYHQRGTARLARVSTRIEPRVDQQGWQALIRVHNQGPGDAHDFEVYQADKTGNRLSPLTSGSRETIPVGAQRDYRLDLTVPRSEMTLVSFSWSDARGTRTQTMGLLELPRPTPDASQTPADAPA